MRRYGYSMGQIYSSHRLIVLKIAVAIRKSFFLIALATKVFMLFFPRTIKISQKVSKMGDIARNV